MALVHPDLLRLGYRGGCIDEILGKAEAFWSQRRYTADCACTLSHPDVDIVTA
jgi:hypothetical protein